MLKYFSTIKITFIFAIVLLSACSVTKANAENKLTKEQIAEIINAPNRFIVDLGGKWEVSLDDENWVTTTIPGAAVTGKRVYFRRTIKIDKKIASKFSWELYFLGLDEKIEVYFNEQFIGKYLGAMTPFSVKIPQRFLMENNNVIKFIISEASGAAAQVKNQNVFAKKIYTGILRELFLIGNPPVYVNKISYQTKRKNSQWSVNANISISAGNIDKLIAKNSFTDSLSNAGISKTNVRVEGSIVNKITHQSAALFSGKIVDVESFRTINLKFRTTVSSPTLWSPDNPYLYELTFRIIKGGKIIDKRTVNIGFVKYHPIKNENLAQLYTNGKRTLIKGVTYIENFKEGKAISYRMMERDIKYIKSNLGANLIRIKYNAPHPYLMNLCDKYGLMVLIELPLYDAPAALYNLDEIRVMMRNLADRYVNNYDTHPSVLAWGLFDGINDENCETSDYLVNTFNNISDKLIFKTIRFGAKNISTDGIDFLGLRDNHNLLSIEQIKSEINRLTGLAGNIPVYVEYGFPIKPDNHNGYSDPLSLESQAYYILNLYHIVQQKKLMGSIISTYRDYYLENPLLIVNNENPYLFTGGLVDIFGKQRLSFKTAFALFNKEKEPLMNAGSYSESTPISYIIIGLLFTVLIIFYINRYNRFRDYFIRAFLRPFNFFADIRDQRIISNSQTIILGFVLSLTIGIYLASVLFYYKTETLTQLVLILIFPARFMREFLFSVIWNPIYLLTTITLFVFINFFILSLFIRLFAFFVRSRIFYKDTLTIVIWSSVPIIVLLPVSIILIKLLVFSPAFIYLIFAALILIFLWILSRILKAVAVVFDTNPTRTYVFGTTIFVVLLMTILFFYQLQYSIFYYTEYIIQNL